ncbi:hypothetical protein E2C01_025810 [Portunus trituberculatus]|uniref:SCAN box domain-containing protein n=1 Tax=Portunus trituberculatus TaxID=210409 RepID=A0A5B7EGG3_PORTR|nr:hypothetical protein [Portunus trituberculatus]
MGFRTSPPQQIERPLLSLLSLLVLSGEAVAQFALQQQAFQREERAQELEREDRAKERERELEEREWDEREKEREVEVEVEALNPTSYPMSRCWRARTEASSLQKGEDIAAYLTRFERIATLLTIDEESLAVGLGSLLTGKAAELYFTFSTDTISNFSLLKRALLTGFDKTPEWYRLDFRNCKIRVGENYRQMSTRLQQLFDSWVESCHISPAFESLRKFIIFDRFIASLSYDLRIFLKEQDTTNLKTVVDKADVWSAVHNTYPKQNSSGATGRSTYHKRASTSTEKGNEAINAKPDQRSYFRMVKCYNWGGRKACKV